MTNKEYHSHPAISKSDIDLFLESPAKFELKKTGKYIKPENSALILGSVTHKLTLERADYESEFITEPVLDKRTKAGKEAYAEFMASLGAKTPVNIDIYYQALAMSDAVLEQSVAQRFLKDGFAERSFFSTYGQGENKLEIKCRPDFYNEKLGVIVDLKTTSNLAEFSKSVGNFNYHIQAAIYSDIMRANGFAVNNFLFVVVEKTAPFLVGFFELSENAVEFGRVCYQNALDKIIALKAAGMEFPVTNSVILGDDGRAQTSKIQTIDLPSWAYNKGA